MATGKDNLGKIFLAKKAEVVGCALSAVLEPSNFAISCNTTDIFKTVLSISDKFW